MDATSGTPRQNVKRKYTWLAGAVVLGVALWSGVWHYGRSVIAHELDAELTRLSIAGIEIGCAQREISGYPFRYDLSCQQLRAADGIGFSAQLAELRAVALMYNPRHIILEADGPAVAGEPRSGAGAELTFETARSSVMFSNAGPDKVDAVLQGPVLTAFNGTASVRVTSDKSELHLRTVPDAPQNLDAFVSSDGLDLTSLSPDLPEFDAKLHIRVPNGTPLLAGRPLAYLPRAADGSLPVEVRLASMTSGTASVSATGELRLKPGGHVSGELDVQLTGVDRIADLLSDIAPAASALPATLQSAAQAMNGGETGETIRLPLTIQDGVVRIGLLPIGQLAPVRVPGF